MASGCAFSFPRGPWREPGRRPGDSGSGPEPAREIPGGPASGAGYKAGERAPVTASDPARNTVSYYDSARQGLLFVEEAHALWAYRHLAVELVVRDLKVRYKRSAVGVGWTMLGPLFQMAALAFAFSAVMRQQISNYPVFFLAGSIFWTFFSQATSHSANLTIDALEVSNRIYIPRSVFVASAVVGAALNLVLALVPLLLIGLVTGHRFTLAALFLLVSVVVGAAFTAGVGLVVFTLASRFLDVRETYLVLIQPLFFLTPIAYTREILPPRFQAIVRLNPLTYLVEMFRAPLYLGWLPGWKTVTFSCLAALLSLVVGWLFYTSRIESYASRS